MTVFEEIYFTISSNTVIVALLSLIYLWIKSNNKKLPIIVRQG